MKKKSYLFYVLIFLVACEPFVVEDISDKSIVAVAPLQGAVVTEGEIGFLWEAIDDAEEYTIQIVTPSFTNANEIIIDSTTTSISFTRDLEVGSYEWRIKAINSEFETDYVTNEFTVNEGEDIESVTLNEPLDAEELTEGEISFSWEEIEDAEEYVFQIATPDFDSASFTVVVNETLTDESYTETLEVGEYQWRVKAMNSEFETDYVTSEFTVTEGEDIESVTLNEPIDNEELTEGEISFSWEEIEDTEEYVFQIATPSFDSDSFTIVVDETLTNNSYTETLEAGEYQWRVKVISSTDESDYTTQDFTIIEEE